MSQPFQFQVTERDAGRRLDEFLWSRFASVSRMRIAGLLYRGAGTVNRVEAEAGYHLAAGDLVEITLDLEAPGAMTPEPLPLDVIYEDDSLLVVIKPAGMLVHPTRSVKTGTLVNALAYHLNEPQISALRFEISSPVIRPGLVHRLDRATSGVMVVAKTPRALSVLSRHFHKRLVEKRYLALVCGRIDEQEGVIRAAIGRDPERRPQWWVLESGKPAETRFRVLKASDRLTLLELEPVTGRTNQLRIHLAYSGHPVAGDEQYAQGSNAEFEISQAPRLCLHAWRLAFHHPAGGRWMEFTSSLPADIASFAASAGLVL
jgi:23S rRNA pseudouridine1911/1915/1917 synthase